MQLPVEQAVARLVEMGPGSLMAKIDIEQAYQNIPVHPTGQTSIRHELE